MKAQAFELNDWAKDDLDKAQICVGKWLDYRWLIKSINPRTCEHIVEKHFFVTIIKPEQVAILAPKCAVV